MMEFIFGTVWGWIGTAGLVVIGCAVVAYFIPQFRIHALAVAGVFISAATIYTKGTRDRARLEARRKEEAVQKARKQYDEIDTRPDSNESVAKRMRDGSF